VPAIKLPDPSAATTQWIKLASIHRDGRVNRPLNDAKVARIREGFDPSLLGVIVVCEITDAHPEFTLPAGQHFHIPLDGQHRAEGARQLWPDDDTQTIEAKVYSGLSIAQMAALFVGLNDSNRPHPIEIFTKRTTGGEPVAVAITEIVRAHGLTVHQPSKDGHVTAVRSLERVYSGFGVNGATPDLLNSTLEIAINAWGRTADAVRAEILEGLGLVLARDRSLIEVPILIRKLAHAHAGAAGVSADAKQLRDLRGGTLRNSVADVIVGIYNRGRRSHRLPDWRA
jgi:hypothetical protein